MVGRPQEAWWTLNSMAVFAQQQLLRVQIIQKHARELVDSVGSVQEDAGCLMQSFNNVHGDYHSVLKELAQWQW